MDAGVGEQLVEVVEPADVADLGEERRRDRRADARDRLEPAGGLAVEERRDAPVGGLDLALEQVVLVEQEADLEGDLGVELGHRDRVGRGGLEPLRLRPPEPSVTRARRWRRPGSIVRRRRRRPRGGRDAEDLAGGPAGRVVEQLAELGEAELDQADEALADLGLLGRRGSSRSAPPGAARRPRADRGRRAASRMPISARLRASAGSDFVRASRLLAKYFAASGLTTATGTSGPAQVRSRAASSSGPTTPSSPGVTGSGWPLEPGVERGEARPGSGSPAGPPGRPSPGRPGSGPPRGSVRRCRSRPSPLGQPPSRTPGVPAHSGRRQLMGPITGRRRRIPITVHGRRSGAGH